MRLFDFVSVRLTFFLILGIVLGFYIELPYLSAVFLFLLCLIFMYWVWKTQHFFEWAAALTVVSLGVLLTVFALGKELPNHYTKFEGQKMGFWQFTVTEVLKPNSYQQRYIVRAHAFEKKVCTGKLILNIAKDSTTEVFQVDDKIGVFGTLSEVNPPAHPHQFDYKDYLKKQGIHHQISITPKAVLQKTKGPKTLLGLAMKTRESLIEKLSQEKFGAEEFGVIQALLLGKRDDISKNTYTQYKNAGAVHILAVSGLHVGVFLWLFQWLLKPLTYLPKGKTIQLVGVVGLLWGYAFIAGMSPSILRAVSMFSFLAYAQYLNRPSNSFNIIALSMLFLLLIHPLFLFQVGFQMSYAAVFFIVWIYPKLQRLWRAESYLVQKVWQLLSVSLAAQLGVLPVSLFYFHQFPALFFVSNLLIVPFLGFILGLGLMVMTLSWINLLPEIMVVVYNFIIESMNTVIAWVANQERFVLQEIPMDGFQMVLLYCIIICTIVFLSKPKICWFLFLITGIVCMQSLAIFRAFKTKNREVVLIGNASKTPVLLHQQQNQLYSYSLDSVTVTSMVKNHKIGEHLDKIYPKPLEHVFKIGKKSLYRVDSLGIFPPQPHVDLLWLSQSPKINLERWLDSLQPQKVIMDGTNYRSYTKRWKETCRHKKIPFHDTREKGVYYFE